MSTNPSIKNEEDTESLIKSASEFFYKHFNSRPSVCGCAPGRVNLIGEHTDYNDGYVLPMALPMVTVVVGRRNDSDQCHIITASPSLDDEIKETTFALPDESNKLLPGKPQWANYVKGVIANFKGKLVGFDAVIMTAVPIGVGLSSSAALEVAAYTFLEELTGFKEASLVDKAFACQKAEHDFLKMPCGIMDQFVSSMGKKDYSLLLDCRSLEYELIKLINPLITVLITSTNVRHKLAESQYSNRKRQCEIATKIIGKGSLRDVSMSELELYKDALGNEIYLRALHVVGENKRTVDAAKALKEGNYQQFGNLMVQSHKSLRDNYEVSCTELDTVVNAACEVEGVYGSRMTGGGFGGCTVTLLKTDSIAETIANIKRKYKNPTFFICRPGDGARGMKLSHI